MTAEKVLVLIAFVCAAVFTALAFGWLDSDHSFGWLGLTWLAYLASILVTGLRTRRAA